MFQGLLPKFAINHPKQIKYLEIWDPHLIISYYTNTFTPTMDFTARYNFLQKKIAIFLGFFLC
jgi:hypothetical protein